MVFPLLCGRYYPKSLRWLKIFASMNVVIQLIAAVIIIMLSVIVYRLAVTASLLSLEEVR